MRLLPGLIALCSSLALASEEAPVSLTASDGTGLTLVRLQVRGVVNDPLAFTELSMVFENPLARVIEGQFKVTLPPGATVSRFAMKTDGRWQEGEVVERQAARRAYEDFLHRRQDPALLEQSGGNEFTAKVFPIPAKGQKEVVLSYSHELVQRTAAYVVPLKGLPEVGTLDVQVSGVEGEATLNKTHFVPNADFQAMPKHANVGVRSGDLVVARVVPVESTEPEALTDFTLLVDSSGSRALGWKDQVTLVKAMLAALPKATVNVVAFDQEVAPIYSGPASGFGDAPLKQLRDRKALGASNVELALQYVASKPTARVVLVSDGVMTAGVTEGVNLTAQVLKLKAAGVKRLDAIALGGLRDTTALGRLTTGSLANDGAVLDGALPVSHLVNRLALTTKSKLEVKVAGASSFWPQTVSGIQAGDAVLVYAQLPAGAPLLISVGGKAMPVNAAGLTSIERPLLDRAWAKTRIDSLQAKLDQADGPAQRDPLAKQIVEVSTKSRVLSSLTALLVLETEADYARFGIDRRALADILTVEAGQVKLTHRTADSVVAVTTPPPMKQPESSRGKDSSRMEKKRLSREDAPSAAPKGGGARPADQADFDDSFGGPGAVAPEPQDGAMEKEAQSPAATRDAPAMRPAATAAASPMPAAPPPPSARRSTSPVNAEGSFSGRSGDAEPMPQGADPYVGTFKDVMDALKRDKSKALAIAWGWHEEQPGDLLALVALGEALEATGNLATAARAYGSIIDLFPARADLRRFAGVRLERITAALALATDTFAKAAEQRPDHPASHRLSAYALVRAGRYEQAFAAIARGLAQQYPAGRFLGVDRILREDAGLIAAAWIKAEPTRRAEILGKLKAAGGAEENGPSVRFVLNWETDSNDVDFHIADARGGHAFYSQPHLASGGDLYADVTTGYGPECFTIRAPKGKRAGPYKLQAHYYSIGPMGAGMGKLEIIDHDGKGGLTFEERPYVVMVNDAFVDLGTVKD